MGFHTANRVINNSQTKGAARAVLLVLALRANDDTMEAFPSLARIAIDAGITSRAVCMALKRIEAIGEILIKTRRGVWRTKGGIQHSNIYRVTVPLLKGSEPRSYPLGAKDMNDVHQGSELRSYKGMNKTSEGSELRSPYQSEEQSIEQPKEQSAIFISDISLTGEKEDEHNDIRRARQNQKRPAYRRSNKAASTGERTAGQYQQKTMVPNLTPNRNP